MIPPCCCDCSEEGYGDSYREQVIINLNLKVGRKKFSWQIRRKAGERRTWTKAWWDILGQPALGLGSNDRLRVWGEAVGGIGEVGCETSSSEARKSRS